MVSGMTSEKARENRIRRTADRRGFVLVKSRRRDPKALDFGLYLLLPHGVDDSAAAAAFRAGEGASLDAIEGRLNET